jgi:hypothetical protein
MKLGRCRHVDLRHRRFPIAQVVSNPLPWW